MRFPAHRVAGEDSLFLLFHRMLASFLPFFPAFLNIIAFQGSFVLLLFLLSLFSGKSLYFKKIKSYFSSFFPCLLANHCISGKSCASSLPFFPVFRKIIVFQENQELLLFLFSLFSGKSLYFREIMCFFSSFFPCFLANHGVSGKSRGAHQCFGTRESSFSCFSSYVSSSGVSDCGKKLLFRNCSVPEQLRSHRQCAPRIPNCLWLGMPAFVLRRLQRGASGCAE